MGQAKRRAIKLRPKVAGDVIAGVAADKVGMDVRANFGESTLDSGRIIRFFDRPGPFCALLCSI